MITRGCFFAAMASVFVGAASRAEPPRYTAVDITGWTPAQLDTLPFFKHIVLSPPVEAPYGFVPVAASAAGHVVGYIPQTGAMTGNQAVFLRGDGGGGHAVEFVDPLGTYSWGYWSCDSTDCHYYSGSIRDDTPGDVNWAGVMVGRTTIPSGGDFSSEVFYHAYSYDGTGGIADLMPGSGYTTAACINNSGEIAGVISGIGGYRRGVDGTITPLDDIGFYSAIPRRINANGVVIGSYYFGHNAFVSPGGSATVNLPDVGGFDEVTANDINDAGWIVGKSGNFGELETFAIIWQPGAGGTWTPFDLVEQLDTPGVLLENAVAINNNGDIIARGHLDGTDFFSSRTYWLAPVTPLPGWCTPEIGLQPQNVSTSTGSAEISVTVVNADEVQSYQWRADGVEIDPAQNASAATATLMLTGLTTADDGRMFDCVITSACGMTISNPATLTIDGPGCVADINNDGVLDLADIGAFVNGFTAQDPIADIDGNGVFDLGDINAFVASFLAGCP